MTGGYRLRAKHVIHAVGPVWNGGLNNEEELLTSCYRTALKLATDHNLKSIAFPAISSGIYRFPANIAARIAVGTVAAEIGRAAASLEQVVFLLLRPRIGQAPLRRVCRARLGVIASMPLRGRGATRIDNQRRRHHDR